MKRQRRFLQVSKPQQLELADVIDRVHASPRPLTSWRPEASPAANGAR
jgi:hypothetical protein